MIIDKELQFSAAQAVIASAASTNVIDQGVAGDLGVSCPMHIAITCDETVTSGGASTVTFSLQESSDNSTFTDVVASAAIAKASLTAGREPIYLTVPPGTDLRYLRVYYTVGTANLTAGKFTAALVEGIQANKAYPDAL